MTNKKIAPENMDTPRAAEKIERAAANNRAGEQKGSGQRDREDNPEATTENTGFNRDGVGTEIQSNDDREVNVKTDHAL